MYGINRELSIHFIGIGGIGMSGIAEILLHLGYKVSGSDIQSNSAVERLKERGAKVFLGHNENNIKEAQLVVYSSAIDETNPEIRKAREDNIPIIRRAEMLAELMRLKFGIAVAGSHGKTTTTSFLATIMRALNYDPTHIIGGIVSNLGGHAGKGEGDYLIAEADESDGSFLYLNPIISVVTNIDNDHLDYYKTEENLINAFLSFVNKVPFYGKIVLNAHDKNIGDNISSIKRPYVTFGIKGERIWCDELDYEASEINTNATETSFVVTHKGQKQKFSIYLPGMHNVLNALGAIATVHGIGASLDKIAEAIKQFKGVARRLEVIKESKRFIMVDDYAHHPTEILATIAAITKKYSGKKIIGVFEPHRYSRTKNFWNDFSKCFNTIDSLYVLPIYAASEKQIPYIDSEILVKSINENGTPAQYLSDYSNIKAIIENNRNEDVLFLTLGAGPISYKVRKIVDEEITW